MRGKKKKTPKKGEVKQESKQHTAEPSALVVSRRGPGEAGRTFSLD